MSSKKITKEARRGTTPGDTQSTTSSTTPGDTPSATQSNTLGIVPGGTLSDPQDIPTPDTTHDVIIYNFPTGRPNCNLKLPEILDKTVALDKYTDRNSMLYTYHQMRRDEQRSISSLANWEQILEEAKE